MGKSSRIKSAKQELMELKRQEEARLAAEKKSKMITTIVTAGICTILAAVFIVVVAVGAINKNNGTALRKQTVLATENFSVSGTTFNYFINYEYQNFINTYANNLASYGLDVSVDLRDQETSDGQNWFDYMAERTKASLEELLRLCEKARAEGYALDEEDEKQLDEFFAQIESEAEENDMSVEKYITTLYGKGVKEKDIEDGLRISMLATKYYDDKIENKAYTEDDFNTYYEENKNSFLAVDYKYYAFTVPTTTNMTDTEATEAYNEIYAKAEKLSKATTPAQFESILTDILKADGVSDEDIEDELAYIDVTNSSYDKDFEVAVWAFGEDAKLNGTKIYKSNTKIEVYMLVKLPYLDESETRSVRHILVTADTYGSDDAAKAKADEILAEFNDGDKTAESFGALAAKYTEDTGSASTGGLYENFAEGEMVEEFEEWSFDEARKAGDTGIVKTTYGYHIMYFVDKGEAVWKTSVKAAMKDSEYTTLYNELKEKYEITFNEDVLDDVNTITIRTSTTASTAA